ncbi:hypothetical protein [Ruegeria sp. HKCCA4008]|uniref:hypothetical protein n=1 Tax=Ruegeria sp. HKCCA4008 TaxID=2682999 RepID=UPI001488D615|nr:hypothetical protein [Ruegeria sp. HKCCA4008]
MSEIEIITDGGRRRRWPAAEKLRIDPKGRVVEDIPILEPTIDWLAVKQEFDIIYGLNQEDLGSVHLNDIKVVTPVFRARIPGSECW